MLDRIAGRVLDAVDRAAPELRYEEKACEFGAGTNVTLRQLLSAQPGDVPYPGCGGLCDLVLELDGVRAWIEVKQAWTWMTYKKPAGSNGAYHKHLFGDTASALHDARDRLPRLLGRPEAQVIGLLVIGLDSVQRPFPIHDLENLARRAGIDQDPWRRFSRPRRASTQPGFEPIGVHAHLWLRPAAPVAVASA